MIKGAFLLVRGGGERGGDRGGLVTGGLQSSRASVLLWKKERVSNDDLRPRGECVATEGYLRGESHTGARRFEAGKSEVASFATQIQIRISFMSTSWIPWGGVTQRYSIEVRVIMQRPLSTSFLVKFF